MESAYLEAIHNLLDQLPTIPTQITTTHASVLAKIQNSSPTEESWSEVRQEQLLNAILVKNRHSLKNHFSSQLSHLYEEIMSPCIEKESESDNVEFSRRLFEHVRKLRNRFDRFVCDWELSRDTSRAPLPSLLETDADNTLPLTRDVSDIAALVWDEIHWKILGDTHSILQTGFASNLKRHHDVFDSRISSSHDQLRTELQSAVNEINKNVADKVNNLEQSIESRSTEVQNIKEKADQESSNVSKSILELSQQIESNGTQVKDLKSQVEQDNQKLTELSSRFQQFQTDTNDRASELREKSAAVAVEIQNLRDQTTTKLESDLTNIREQLTTKFDSEVANLREQTTARFDSELPNIRESIEILKSQLSSCDLEGKLDTTAVKQLIDESSAGLQPKLEALVENSRVTLNQIVSDIRQQLNFLQERVDAIPTESTEEITRIESLLEHHQSDIAITLKQMSEASIRFETNQSAAVETMKGEIAGLQAQASEITKVLEANSGRIQSALDTLGTFQTQIEQSKPIVDPEQLQQLVNSGLDGIRNKVDEITTALQEDIKRQIAELKRHQGAVQVKLEGTIQQRDGVLNESVVRLKSQLNDIKQMVEDVSNNNHQKTIDDLAQQIRALSDTTVPGVLSQVNDVRGLTSVQRDDLLKITDSITSLKDSISALWEFVSRLQGSTS
eukprot:c3221_g1_i1.p1 GENE.c3221_g1_i1~~c3221_g1_i1.p1  ORF type:complete len:675 (+),score=225.69 c3221_g1_i1:2-2026(+)